MKNIKEILKENDAAMETPKLPTGHRADFFEKLSAKEEIISTKEPFQYWKSIAAACVLLIGLGAFVYSNYSIDKPQESSLFVEMKSIEDEYLKHIEMEWNAFQLSANDTHLVKKYKERLESLDESYQDLKQEFLVQKNSLTALEKMIKNLQMRLTLLQEIQEHLKRLEDEQKNI